MDSQIIHRPNGHVDCNLADDVLIEILSRLSSRVVTRCKLVCKHWNSLISSHHFIILFNCRRNEEASSPAEYSLVFQSRGPRVQYNNYYSSILHCGSGSVVQRVHKLDLSFVPNSTPITINASCGDLILCSHYDKLNPSINRFYICNPRNKQCLPLPGLSFPLKRGWDTYHIGLLYLPSRPDKFAVVLIGVSHALKPTSTIEVVLFSSEEGRWRELVISSPKELGYDDGLSKNLVPYKGKLHLVKHSYLLAYDPFNDPEKISQVIRMQMVGVNNDSSFRSAGVIRDRIRVAYTATAGSFDYRKFHYVWELEDYDIGKWRMVNKVGYNDRIDRYRYALHDGNALFWWKKCSLWVENLQQSNGVLPDEDRHQCELAHRLPRDFSFLFALRVNQVDHHGLPTSLPTLNVHDHTFSIEETVDNK